MYILTKTCRLHCHSALSNEPLGLRDRSLFRVKPWWASPLFGLLFIIHLPLITPRDHLPWPAQLWDLAGVISISGALLWLARHSSVLMWWYSLGLCWGGWRRLQGLHWLFTQYLSWRVCRERLEYHPLTHTMQRNHKGLYGFDMNKHSIELTIKISLLCSKVTMRDTYRNTEHFILLFET